MLYKIHISFYSIVISNMYYTNKPLNTQKKEHNLVAPFFEIFLCFNLDYLLETYVYIVSRTTSFGRVLPLDV